MNKICHFQQVFEHKVGLHVADVLVACSVFPRHHETSKQAGLLGACRDSVVVFEEI